MGPMDLLKFNQCNLDHLTETYNINFYLEYFTKWPQLCLVLEDRHGQIEAYSKPCFHPTIYNTAPLREHMLVRPMISYTKRPAIPIAIYIAALSHILTNTIQS